MLRIGLYGGTFDPVHTGHLELAKGAIEEMGLDRLFVIPAAVPPHKTGTPVTPFLHRLAMLRIAFEGVDCVEVSTIEQELPTPSYTVDTIEAFTARYGSGNQLCFLIGADSFLDLCSWKSYKELLANVTLVVAMREGISHEKIREMEERINYTAKGLRLESGNGLHDIFFMKASIPAISSSDVRKKLAGRERQVDSIPAGVMAYILDNNLYRG